MRVRLQPPGGGSPRAKACSVRTSSMSAFRADVMEAARKHGWPVHPHCGLEVKLGDNWADADADAIQEGDLVRMRS